MIGHMENIKDLVRQRLDKVIFENEMMKAGFTAIPNLLLRDTNLSIGARFTYIVLSSYAWQSDSTFVGQDQMATDMGVSERQAQRYIYELRDNGYIVVSREDRRFNNTYILKDVKTKLKAKKRARHDTSVVSETTSMSGRI